MKYKYPTAYSSWGAEEKAAIERVLASGRLTMGVEVEAFESEFAAAHNMRHGVMVNSGSSANLVAVAALLQEGFIGKAQVVSMPAVAWSTTYAPFVQLGVEIKLRDVDDTWNAPATIGYGPYVACSILGNPQELLGPMPVLEDNCESLGAIAADGSKCGTRGLLNTFSFFYSHQIGAVEGGMILTNDRDLADACKMLRSHGWSRDIKAPTDFSEEYDFLVFGFNVRPVEMHAAIAREQLKKLDDLIWARLWNAQQFRQMTKSLHPLVRHQEWKGGYPSPFGMSFEVPVTSRRRVVTALRDAGIDCRLPTGGSFREHVYGRSWRHHLTPRADNLHHCGLFIGCPPRPEPELLELAEKALRKVLS